MNNRSYLLNIYHVPGTILTCLMCSFPKPRASFYCYTILQMRELRHREIKWLAQDRTARRSRVKHSGPWGRQSDSWDLVLCQHAILPSCGLFVRVNLWVCFNSKVAVWFLELNVTFLSYAVYDEMWVHPQHWETTTSWETTEKRSSSNRISLLLGCNNRATVLGWTSCIWLFYFFIFYCCSIWSSGHLSSQASCLRTDARHQVTKWRIAPSPWSRREMGEGPC